MILKIIKKPNDFYLYIQKSIYINGKVSSINVLKCGKLSDLQKLFDDPIAHFTNVAKDMTEKEKAEPLENKIINIEYKPNLLISKNEKNSFYAGHLFINKIYYQLAINQFCKNVTKEHKFKFDLNSIFSYLINATILSPDSKLGIFEEKDNFIDAPNFELCHLYRSLEYITKHNQELQAHLYNSSKALVKRDTSILFYDCTNYFFEIDDEDDNVINEDGSITRGKRSYGHCKRNSKLPITQLGLFMDANGFPLAFTTFPGAASEQKTMTPLEKRIMKDFNLSKFITCTDAGLSSYSNKKFNTGGERAYVTTQSLRKSKQNIVDWCVATSGWYYIQIKENKKILHSDIDIASISEEDFETTFSKTIFYKDRLFKYECEVTNDEGKKVKVQMEERFVVTYCYKYKLRNARSREKMINKATTIIKTQKKILKDQFGLSSKYIKSECFTDNGELAENVSLTLDEEVIREEAKFDGFYLVTTNLFSSIPGDAYEIVKINSRRWEIEETFRIMKQYFKTRPIYLQREYRIDAHLTINFVALLIFRILESKLNVEDNYYTYPEIIEGLRKIKLTKLKNQGFCPAFERTDFIDNLTNIFKIELRSEILTHQMIAEQIKKSKKS